MKIVILDSFTITQSDLSFDSLKQLDKVDKLTVYERTAPNEIAPIIEGYDMVLTSKCKLTEEIIKNTLCTVTADKLKGLCIIRKHYI